MYASSTTGSTGNYSAGWQSGMVIISFGTPLCQHVVVDSYCDPDAQELRFLCQHCGKLVGFPREQVAADPDGSVTRKLLAFCFGPQYEHAVFPWECIYPCHAVGCVGARELVQDSPLMRYVRSMAGALAAWLWRYCILWEA